MSSDGLYISVNASLNNSSLFYELSNLVSNAVKETTTLLITKYPSNQSSEYNTDKQGDYGDMINISGIIAEVSSSLAQAILDRANYYCPVDTGRLRDSGHIENMENGRSMIIYDCPYAWYVHELENKKHAFPTCAHFLTRAINDILGTSS